MSFTSDEINYMIYRYLLEAGKNLRILYENFLKAKTCVYLGQKLSLTTESDVDARNSWQVMIEFDILDVITTVGCCNFHFQFRLKLKQCLNA